MKASDEKVEIEIAAAYCIGIVAVDLPKFDISIHTTAQKSSAFVRQEA